MGRFSGEPVQGRIIALADTPRSYLVHLPSGEVRRNRHQLKPVHSPIEKDPKPKYAHNIKGS